MKGILYSTKTVKFIFAALIALTGASLWTLSGLKTQYSMKQFYPQDHPLLKKDREIRRTFRLNERSPFLFVLSQEPGKNWLEKNQILKLKKLTVSLQEHSKVAKSLSLTAVEGASQKGQSLVVGNIFDRTPQSQWKGAVLSNSLLYPLLVSEDFRSTLLVVEPKPNEYKNLDQFHSSILKMIQKEFPNTQIASAGVPMIQTQLSKLIHSELSRFLVIAVLLFCGIFYFLFSHWSAIALAFIALLTSNIFGLALLTLLDVPMNVVLVTLPIILSVSVMSLLIHTLHLWSDKGSSNLSSFQDRWTLAIRTMGELWLPNLLGSLTTALGFLALITSPIPLIKEYAWVVALAVGVVSTIGQFLILIALPFVKPKIRSWFARPAFWTLLSIQHSRKILYSILAISVVCLCLAPRLNFSGRLFDDLPKSDGVRASMEKIDNDFGGVIPNEMILTARQENFWKNPKHLKALDQVASDIRKRAGVGSVVTVADFFQGELPKTPGPIAETFFLFSMAEKNPLAEMLTENAKSLRIMIRLQDQASDKMSQIRKGIRASLQKKFPEVRITEGGMATYAHAINQEVSHELVFGFWQSIWVIGIFLMIVFRSFKWALIACLPNFVPPALMMGALVWTQTPLKPGAALIFSIALGFAFNNTVYILSRVRQLMKANPSEPLPLKQALLMEGNPCFFESFVMFSGFAIFLTSHFSMNQTFGAFMMISIVAGFIADLFFLPALLHNLSRFFANPVLQPVPLSIVKGPEQDGSDSDSDNHWKKTAAAVALVICSVVGSSAKAQTATEILKKSQAQLDAKDDQAEIEMKIIEKNGEVKTRVIDMKTMRSGGFSVLARIKSPADIKGMGFLGKVNNGQEAQWIYLPSSGQVRRLVTGKTTAGLLGSEISPEDLNSEAIRSSSVKIAKQDAQNWWLEITPKPSTSIYSKVQTQISKSDFLPQSTEYFVQKRLKKTVKFEHYKKMGSVWRAQTILVKNHLNGRGTQVRLSQMKMNAGLKADEFSQTALKED